ncbi:MAG: methyltransferase domain-containing protein [Anaerolineae bacterium]|nr:methyltransferase domain-containing protein [Anaerolineae bacterium]
MAGNFDDIARFYDSAPEHEWTRMDRNRTEFAVTLRAFADHLPKAPARILDCGGGPGRYAIVLARQGYDVTLFDLSQQALNLARARAAAAGVTLAGIEHGSATDLSRFPDGVFDAVLLMGPLYHLLDPNDRLQALQESARVLRPGGILCAAFITRYAAHRYYAAHRPEQLVFQVRNLPDLLEDGLMPSRGGDRPEFIVHMAHPSEAPPLCRGAGLEVVEVLGVEGVVSGHATLVNALDGELWELWVDVNYRVAHDPAMHAAADHLLAICTKPRWRAVLADLARSLAAEALPYKVMGGAAVALHGVAVPVHDIDLELPLDAVYRFGERYAAQAVLPVAYREGEAYRSHFGRFDFAGVTVEVMAGLERREGDRWVSSLSATETFVDLAGTPVRVEWLEESTLANIRRGRLERAALCLRHCDRDRLLALARGQHLPFAL